jgi:hypothetical protein
MSLSHSLFGNILVSDVNIVYYNRSPMPSLYLHNPSTLSYRDIDSGPISTSSLPKISGIQAKSVLFDPLLRSISVKNHGDTAKKDLNP